jgi:hypothetical protein
LIDWSLQIDLYKLDATLEKVGRGIEEDKRIVYCFWQ